MVENTLLLTGAGVAIQVVLGTALALFFNQQLRGSWIVRGILILPMLLTPIVVGLMWRALLNPEWGLLNWVAVELGFGYVGWLSDPHVAIWTLILVDSWQWTPFVFVIVYARLQALPHEVFEAGSVDGANWFQWTAYLTLPLLAPAIIFAAVFRAIDAFRTFDLVYGLTNGGPVNSTTTLSFLAFQNGFEFQHYGYASAISYVMVLAAAIGVTLLFKVVKVRRVEVRRDRAPFRPGPLLHRADRDRPGRSPAVRLPAAPVDQVAARHPGGAAVPRLRLGDDQGELRGGDPRGRLLHLREELGDRDGRLDPDRARARRAGRRTRSRDCASAAATHGRRRSSASGSCRRWLLRSRST